MNRIFRTLCAVLALLALTAPAFAHPMPSSAVLLDVQAQKVSAEVQIPLSNSVWRCTRTCWVIQRPSSQRTGSSSKPTCPSIFSRSPRTGSPGR